MSYFLKKKNKKIKNQKKIITIGNLNFVKFKNKKKNILTFFQRKINIFFSYFWVLTSPNFLNNKVVSLLLGLFFYDGTFIKKIKLIFTELTKLTINIKNEHNFFFQKNTKTCHFKCLIFLLLQKKIKNKKTDFSFFSFYCFFKKITYELKLTYRIIFISLSRRVRKIVKNKFKFRRQYVCVPPKLRLKYGIHLIKFCLKFVEGKT
jgi:hypothetical protein